MTSSPKSKTRVERKAVGGFISAEKLQSMCGYFSDDVWIAKYLGCTVKQVAAARARMASVASSRRVSHYDDLGPVVSTPDVREAVTSAKYASRSLLIAQLKFGQHWLQPDAFWDTVNELRAQGCDL